MWCCKSSSNIPPPFSRSRILSLFSVCLSLSPRFLSLSLPIYPGGLHKFLKQVMALYFSIFLQSFKIYLSLRRMIRDVLLPYFSSSPRRSHIALCVEQSKYLSNYLCMYVQCMYECIYVCMYVSMDLSTHQYIFIYMYIICSHMHTYIYMYICVCVCDCVFIYICT